MKKKEKGAKTTTNKTNVNYRREVVIVVRTKSQGNNNQLLNTQ